tara:strand:- start:283 stop:492 length:210 start_codon:yes stop_codon:yes gene_type:complete
MNKEILDALNSQIEKFEKKGDHYANADDANKLIKALGGTCHVDPMKATESVGIYITFLAVKKMFESGEQ